MFGTEHAERFRQDDGNERSTVPVVIVDWIEEAERAYPLVGGARDTSVRAMGLAKL